jgi:hypothetical protein
MSIDWDHDLSLAAEGDRSYPIASICGLCSDGADQCFRGVQHRLGVENDPPLPRPLESRLLGSGCDLLSCGVIRDGPNATGPKINTDDAHVVIRSITVALGHR